MFRGREEEFEESVRMRWIQRNLVGFEILRLELEILTFYNAFFLLYPVLHLQIRFESRFSKGRMSSNKDYRPIPTEEAASSSTSTSNHPSSHSHPHSSSSTFNSYKPHPSIKQTFLSYIALIFCSSFILFSLFLSFFSSSNPIHLSKGQRPPLKPIERNDLTWNDEKCRKEFPAFYPQLEQNARAWRFKGGITKDQVQRAKDGNSQRWGYARVSDRQVVLCFMRLG